MEDFPKESKLGNVHSTTYEGKLYDVYKLIAYSETLPQVDAPLDELGACLDVLCWSGQNENTKIGPNTIIKAFREAGSWDKLYELYPELSRHAKRVQFADLSHPILLDPENHVIDGVHRLTKAFIEGQVAIKAKKLDKIPEAAVLASGL